MDCTQRIVVDDAEINRHQVATLFVSGSAHTVYSGFNSVGRDPESSDIFIDNSTVSKRHAVIRVLDHKHVIFDVNSSNKTIIETEEEPLIPYDKYPLKHKCSLQFGEVRGEYCYEQEELNSQVEECNPDVVRPSNPLEKIFNKNTDSELNTQSSYQTEDFSGMRPPSPIIDSQFTKRRVRRKVRKLSDSPSQSEVDTQSEIKSGASDIHDMETQPTNATNISIHEMETQVSESTEISIHDMETQVSDTAKDSIHDMETQVLMAPESPNHNVETEVSKTPIQDIETKVSNTSPLPNHNIETKVSKSIVSFSPDLISTDTDAQINSSDQLRLSESLNTDTIQKDSADFSPSLDSSSFFIPATPGVSHSFLQAKYQKTVLNPENKCSDITKPNIADEIINSKKDHKEIVFTPDSELDDTTELKENVNSSKYDKSVFIPESEPDITEPNIDDEEVIDYKEESNMSSDCNFDNISSQCLLRSFPALPSCDGDESVQEESTNVKDNVIKSSKNDVGDEDLTDCEDNDEKSLEQKSNPIDNEEKKQSVVETKEQTIINDSVVDGRKTPVLFRNSPDLLSPDFIERSSTPDILVEQDSIFNQPTQLLNNNTNKSAEKLDDDPIYDAATQLLPNRPIKKERKSLSRDGSFASDKYDIYEQATQKFPSENNSKIALASLSAVSNESDDIYSKTTQIYKPQEKNNSINLSCIADDDDIYEQSTQLFPGRQSTSTFSTGKNNNKLLGDVESLNLSKISSLGSEVNFGKPPKTKKYASSTPMVTEKHLSEDRLKPDQDAKSSDEPVLEKNDKEQTGSGRVSGVMPLNDLPDNDQFEDLYEDSESVLQAELSMKLATDSMSKRETKEKLREIFGGSSESELDTSRATTSTKVRAKRRPPVKQEKKKVQEVRKNPEVRKSTRARKAVKNFDDLFGESTESQSESQNEGETSNRKRNNRKPKASLQKCIVKHEALESQSSDTTRKSKRGKLDKKEILSTETAKTKPDRGTRKKVLDSIDEVQNSRDISEPSEEVVIKQEVIEEINISPKIRTSKRRKVKQESLTEVIIKTEIISPGRSSNKESNHLSESTRNIMPPSNKTNLREKLTPIVVVQDVLINKDSAGVENSPVKAPSMRGRKRQSQNTSSSQENVDVLDVSAKKQKLNHDESAKSSVNKGGKTRLSLRDEQKNKYRILFTSVNDDQLIKLANSLGGLVVDNHKRCNILIAPRIIRTVKFLCCLTKGIPIVSAEWLIQSSKAKKFLDPWQFITSDKVGESKYKFDLAKSLKRAQNMPLLKGYTVMGTANIVPQLKETQDIVESSGGKFVTRVPGRGFKEPAFIISCEEDRECWPKKSKKPIPPIVKAECLLTGILQQKLHFPLHLLT